MQYYFILGKNPKLSIAEISSIIKDDSFEYKQPNLLFLNTTEINALNLIKHLGGTIKIGKIIGNISPYGRPPEGRKKLDDLSELVLKELKDEEGKIFFGISDYANHSPKDIKHAAMNIKKDLKKLGSVRWVTSKEKILSSVVVKTNKLLTRGAEICLFKNGLVGKTLAVQEFGEFEKREFQKPERDILRGMIPVKLAKIMINLSEANKSAAILDPFCGTGTVLIEAMVAGHKKIIGSDNDAKAINQSSKNIHWVRENYELENIDVGLFISKAEEVSKEIKLNSVDAIITEPYLGPLQRGSESKEQIKKIINELSELYLNSFKEWKKILKKNARVIMIFPIFKNGCVDIKEDLIKIGYKKINTDDLIYERPGQKVLRRIDIFEKN